MNVVCFHLEFSATDRLLVQRCPTACSVPEIGRGTS